MYTVTYLLYRYELIECQHSDAMEIWRFICNNFPVLFQGIDRCQGMLTALGVATGTIITLLLTALVVTIIVLICNNCKDSSKSVKALTS